MRPNSQGGARPPCSGKTALPERPAVRLTTPLTLCWRLPLQIEELRDLRECVDHDLHAPGGAHPAPILELLARKCQELPIELQRGPRDLAGNPRVDRGDIGLARVLLARERARMMDSRRSCRRRALRPTRRAPRAAPSGPCPAGAAFPEAQSRPRPSRRSRSPRSSRQPERAAACHACRGSEVAGPPRSSAVPTIARSQEAVDGAGQAARPARSPMIRCTVRSRSSGAPVSRANTSRWSGRTLACRPCSAI